MLGNPLSSIASDYGPYLALVMHMTKRIRPRRNTHCTLRENPSNVACLLRATARHIGDERSRGARRGMQHTAGSALPIIKGALSGPRFHRVESPSQTRSDAAQQVASMEVW